MRDDAVSLSRHLCGLQVVNPTPELAHFTDPCE